MSIRLTIVDEATRAALRAAGLAAYDDFLNCAQGKAVHQSVTTIARRMVLRNSGIADTLYLKIYRRGPLGGWMRNPPEREARNYLLLRDRCDINVPEVIAFGARGSLGRWKDGFILTRAVPNAVSLDRFAECAAPLRRYLFDCTSALVARMHAAGFYHIDLQWRNLLISDDGSETPDIYVIDSARGGLRRWRVLREHGRLRDLSSLYKEARYRLTAREQLRWLRAYLGVRRFAPHHRALIRTIQYDRAVKDHEA